MRELCRMKKETNITPNILMKLIDFMKPELDRRTKLFEYYKGNHDINSRTFADNSKVDNKVVNPFPKMITDYATGYFIGKPIAYEHDKLDLIKPIIDYNDDPSVNYETAKNASVCGYAYNLLYLDRYGELRYQSIDPRTCFCVYDEELDAEVIYFIRTYREYNIEKDIDIEYCEVYDNVNRALYSRTNNQGFFQLIEINPHYFNEVPAIEIVNNEEGQGDFEPVLSLINAYDVLISDAVNDAEEFSDAYLVLKGMDGTTTEDIEQARHNRALLIPEDADASWLTKQMDTEYSESLKTRIVDEIHKFAGVPDISDNEFSGNTSGVAIKYKLFALEEITAKKEGFMRRAIIRRIEIIAEYLKLTKGQDIDFKEMHVTFKRNIPVNINEAAEVIQKVGHLMSTRTQLEMLPIDIDVDQEIDRLKEEEELEIDSDGLSRDWTDD